MEHLRRFFVALTNYRKTKTMIEVTDADAGGDVFVAMYPDGNEQNLYMSRADAIVFATALLEAANARKQ